MAAMEGCIFISKDPRLFESSVPMPKGDFPRANHETSLHIIAAPPYASDEADRDCLWAARKASTTWRKAIDQAAKLAGITFYDAYAPIDDTGFALAVLDKVCELCCFYRGFNDEDDVSPLPYEDWLRIVNRWIDDLYTVACRKSGPSSTPPSLEWVRDLVISGMNMVCNEEDTYNPPFPDPRQFNVGRLGRYSSQYYDQWTYRITEDLDSGKMRGKHILHRGKVWRPTESVDKNPGGVRSPSEDKGPDTVWPFSELYDDDELGDDDASGDDDESDESEDEDYVVIHAVHLSTAKR